MTDANLGMSDYEHVGGAEETPGSSAPSSFEDGLVLPDFVKEGTKSHASNDLQARGRSRRRTMCWHPQPNVPGHSDEWRCFPIAQADLLAFFEGQEKRPARAPAENLQLLKEWMLAISQEDYARYPDLHGVHPKVEDTAQQCSAAEEPLFKQILRAALCKRNASPPNPEGMRPAVLGPASAGVKKNKSTRVRNPRANSKVVSEIEMHCSVRSGQAVVLEETTKDAKTVTGTAREHMNDTVSAPEPTPVSQPARRVARQSAANGAGSPGAIEGGKAEVKPAVLAPVDKASVKKRAAPKKHGPKPGPSTAVRRSGRAAAQKANEKLSSMT